MRITHAVCSLSLVLGVIPSARAQEFFSEPELNFWNEAQAPRVAQRPRWDREERRADAVQPFRWEDYENPETEAFWDDGNHYLPPAPLRVAAANPTEDNVARYLRWQKRKMSTIATLQQEVSRQAGSEAGPELPRQLRPTPSQTVVAGADRQAEVLADNAAPVEWQRLEVVFFYASDCPHCQASLGTVGELERRGVKVIPVQMDWKERPPLLPGSVRYGEEIAKEQPIDSVPTWVAVYGGDRFTMQGEVTAQSMEVTLKLAQQQKQQERDAASTPTQNHSNTRGVQ